MSRLSDCVCELAGVTDGESAQRIVRATMSVLLEQLAPADRAWLVSLVADDAEEVGTAGAERPVEGLRDFFARVAAREGEQLGFATEHAQSVCRAVALLLEDDALHRLTSRLPDTLVALFARPEWSAPPPHDRPRGAHHTLAEGRSGSSRPLSEAAPSRAHRESVARSDNPHADTKLSSNRGTTQEREAETLADAHGTTQEREAETLAEYDGSRPRR
jgi:uncharacterized protein (DUF2267 family)